MWSGRRGRQRVIQGHQIELVQQQLYSFIYLVSIRIDKHETTIN